MRMILLDVLMALFSIILVEELCLILGKNALGAYANYERMALNSGGSNIKEYGFYLDIMSETNGKENLPAYAKRVDVMTLGLNAFVRMKNPLGFYVEYSPGKLMYNDGWWKFRVGAILLY